MDPRLVAVATRVVARWLTHPHYQDLLQVALLAAWEHPAQDMGHVGRTARNAVVDELRRYYGRTGGRRQRLGRTVPLDDVDEPLVEQAPPELSTALGLDGRQAFIVDALGRGWSKRDIAEVLGVHPSRVSQLLADVRRSVRS